MPKISVIMPAYNVGEYIRTAIDSILGQTFKDWELIITDDCSTDNTVDIIEGFCKKHHNIRLIRRTNNSGGARLPRKEAAHASTGDFIMIYDADDFLDNDYIEKMYNRLLETEANIVLSTLYFCNYKGELNGHFIPKTSFPLKNIMSGKDATKLLLGEVSISVSGPLIERQKYLDNISSGESEEDNYSYVDEIDQRRLLFSCEKVAFADTKYYYRQHSESLMHKKDIKRYNFLQTSRNIYEFAKTHYTENEVFIRLQRDYIQTLMFCQRDYYRYKHYKASFSKKATTIIKESFKYAKQEGMRPQGFKQKVCMHSYSVFRFVTYIYNLFLFIKNK